MHDDKRLVSAAELEALIQDWGASPHLPVDRFFPLRFYFLFAVILGTSVWMLFSANTVALSLTQEPNNVVRLQNFLYFRGWFLLLLVAVGTYAYLGNWYPAIVFSAFLLLGLTNLVFDIFTVFPERLASPSPLFTLFLLLRLCCLWVVFLSIKNASRIPPIKDRLKLSLIFRRSPRNE